MGGLTLLAGIAILAAASSMWSKPDRKFLALVFAVIGFALLVLTISSWAEYQRPDGLIPMAAVVVGIAAVAAGHGERARSTPRRRLGLGLYVAGIVLTVGGVAGLLLSTR